MLRIQMIGLALVAALAMSVVAASSASAAHLWLINGKLAKAADARELIILAMIIVGQRNRPEPIHCKAAIPGGRTNGVMKRHFKLWAQRIVYF